MDIMFQLKLGQCDHNGVGDVHGVCVCVCVCVFNGSAHNRANGTGVNMYFVNCLIVCRRFTTVFQVKLFPSV